MKEYRDCFLVGKVLKKKKNSQSSFSYLHNRNINECRNLTIYHNRLSRLLISKIKFCFVNRKMGNTKRRQSSVCFILDWRNEQIFQRVPTFCIRLFRDTHWKDEKKTIFYPPKWEMFSSSTETEVLLLLLLFLPYLL